MKDQTIGILHYSVPPVIGGVEAVIKAHTAEILRAGYSCTVIAGRGHKSAFPAETNFISISEIDSNHPKIQSASHELEFGRLPENFETLEELLESKLEPVLEKLDHLIVHNVLTKHFNLPLTKALFKLNARGLINNLVAWCHDFTWTSSSSQSKVHAGDPWDLLRSKWANTLYVTISTERQQILASLLDCPPEDIPVVYNGVTPEKLLGLSTKGWELIHRLDMLASDINILMPVRVTRAKNIEFAIQVAAALNERAIDSRIVLTGPPDPHDSDSMKYFQSLKYLRDSLGVQENVRFVFDSGLEPGQPFTVEDRVVGDLYRISDLMFMPSHREGFGMPVLEAGLAGIPVLSREVPAAKEIAGDDAVIFDEETTSGEVAEIILHMMKQKSTVRFRSRVRKEFTWKSIFENEIEPILQARRKWND